MRFLSLFLGESDYDTILKRNSASLTCVASSNGTDRDGETSASGIGSDKVIELDY